MSSHYNVPCNGVTAISHLNFMIHKLYITGLLVLLTMHVNAVDKQLRLRLTEQQTGFIDETFIYLDLGITPAFTFPEDAPKIFSNDTTFPHIYSFTTDSVACYSNGYGAFVNTVRIRMGVRLPGTGTYRIQASVINNFDATTILRLHDKATGQMHDLRQGDYVFQQNSAVTDNDRFTLHISRPVALQTINSNCDDLQGSIAGVIDSTITWNSIKLFNINNVQLQSLSNVSESFFFNGLSAGSYLVVFQYEVYTATVNVTVNTNQVTVNIGNPALPVQVNQEVQFMSIGKNTETFAWDFGEGTTITGIANPTVAYYQAGTYWVVVTCTNSVGCSDVDSVLVTVTPPTSVTDPIAEQLHISAMDEKIHVFPASYDYPYQLSVIDLSGREVIQVETPSITDVSSLHPGVYLVSVRNNTTRTLRKILIP